ncbi:F-box protein [Cardamine amara subsp. amara]|uniref:F-box protein n=1 Tax=Cardamine amara subsp. amara TaxID=228776 RepID=A0ABD1BDV2_CARAN
MKTRRRIGLKRFFAYDPFEKQFKVLSMTWPVHGRNLIFQEYQVPTLGTGEPSWRMVKCCIPHFSPHEGISINGVLFYKASANTNSLASMIVCFDVRLEKFKFIQVGESNFHYGTLINYKEDVEKQEWSEHIYVLPALCQSLVGPQHYLNFVGVTRTNEIVLSPRYQKARFYVFYYNFERNTLIRVEIHGMEESFCHYKKTRI